ncbi:MAG: 4'-phosphopantetheinyl transferase superfamily protein [Mycoplasmataceae bacterium]|nr:4'-phosphopantetheinyl transferase superfamily protein [Mycoplasmataceae bacterium]
MNIIGIGTDIVSKNRIKVFNVKNKFLNKDELNLLKTFKKDNKLNFISGRWASKESIIKSFDKSITFSQISILKYKSGKPKVLIDGIERKDILLSISHEKDFTVAFSMLVKV